MKVAILGAGAAGLFAALELTQISTENSANAISGNYQTGFPIEIALFDRNPFPGRKLAITGSGRGNLTNFIQSPDFFSSTGDLNPYELIRSITPQELCDRLLVYGVPTTQTDDGWVYPVSLSAANVSNILTDRLLATENVRIHSETRILEILKENRKFTLISETHEKFSGFDVVLVSTGSKAYPQIGSDDSILAAITRLGIKTIPFQPALTGFILEKPDKTLSGVRLNAEVALQINGGTVEKTFGNLIFTDSGVNGPAVMNLSKWVPDAIAAGDTVQLRINWLPVDYHTMLSRYYFDPAFQATPYRNLFCSILPEKVVKRFFGVWKLDSAMCVGSIDKKQFFRHLEALKNTVFSVRETKSFRDAQVCSGGISLSEIHPATFQSKKCPGLYFAGEVLDCVGYCGGYNLTWAFSSAIIAANGILSEFSCPPPLAIRNFRTKPNIKKLPPR